MRKGVLSLIGGATLIELVKVLEHSSINLYAKIEALNPGGSIKDRTALAILNEAIRAGRLRAGDTVIESSSGNMGIGLAQVCVYLDLNFVCVVDPKTTTQNLDILRAYGAKIEMITDPDPVTGEYLGARLARVKQLLLASPKVSGPTNTQT